MILLSSWPVSVTKACCTPAMAVSQDTRLTCVASGTLRPLAAVDLMSSRRGLSTSRSRSCTIAARVMPPELTDRHSLLHKAWITIHAACTPAKRMETLTCSLYTSSSCTRTVYTACSASEGPRWRRNKLQPDQYCDYGAGSWAASCDDPAVQRFSKTRQGAQRVLTSLARCALMANRSSRAR